MNPLGEAMTYILENSAEVGELFGQHLRLSAIALAAALLVALPLGIVLVRQRWLAGPVLAALGLIYTIPSLALLIMLIPVFGLSSTTAVVTLAIYAQIILVRNITTGLQAVDPAVLEAATGIGMGAWQRWWRVELPLALPLILAGIRIAAITIIGIAALGAKIAAGGLGVLLFQGIAFNNDSMIYAGVLVLGLLALGTNGILLLLERLVDPLARSRRGGRR